MFWPGYATPAQSPWGLAPDLNATTATASWSIHPPARSAFELPILRADVAAYQSSDNVSKPDTVDESSAAAALHAEIKEERISPLPTNDVAEKTQDMSSTSCNPADSITAAVDQSIRIRDNLTTTGWASPSARSPKSASLDDRNSPSPVLSAFQQQGSSSIPSADYSGLQLLSDSIERFVSSADQAKLAYQPEPIKTDHCSSSSSDNPMTVEVAGNALDVLCAAALYQQTDPVTTTTTIEGKEMATPCIPLLPAGTGFQMEFDFRSKLAELQRKYKEKQKELSSLSESFNLFIIMHRLANNNVP